MIISPTIKGTNEKKYSFTVLSNVGSIICPNKKSNGKSPPILTATNEKTPLASGAFNFQSKTPNEFATNRGASQAENSQKANGFAALFIARRYRLPLGMAQLVADLAQIGERLA